MTEPTNTTPNAPTQADDSQVGAANGQRARAGAAASLAAAAKHNGARARLDSDLVGAAIQAAGDGPRGAATCR